MSDRREILECALFILNVCREEVRKSNADMLELKRHSALSSSLVLREVESLGQVVDKDGEDYACFSALYENVKCIDWSTSTEYYLEKFAKAETYFEACLDILNKKIEELNDV